MTAPALAVLTLALAARAAAVPATPTPVERASPFEPLAFLAGSCWRGAFPNGKAHDEHCWDWLYDGTVLRDRHVVRGEGPDYEGLTLYAFDPQKKAVVYHYYTNAGHVSSGTFEVTAEGIVFPERVRTSGGERELKSVLTRRPDGSYQMRALERSGEEWKELWSMTLRRVRSVR
jgi:hypothetical protein